MKAIEIHTAACLMVKSAAPGAPMYTLPGGGAPMGTPPDLGIAKKWNKGVNWVSENAQTPLSDWLGNWATKKFYPQHALTKSIDKENWYRGKMRDIIAQSSATDLGMTPQQILQDPRYTQDIDKLVEDNLYTYMKGATEEDITMLSDLRNDAAIAAAAAPFGGVLSLGGKALAKAAPIAKALSKGKALTAPLTGALAKAPGIKQYLGWNPTSLLGRSGKGMLGLGLAAPRFLGEEAVEQGVALSTGSAIPLFGSSGIGKGFRGTMMPSLANLPSNLLTLQTARLSDQFKNLIPATAGSSSAGKLKSKYMPWALAAALAGGAGLML